jgi:hypothetical protein
VAKAMVKLPLLAFVALGACVTGTVGPTEGGSGTSSPGGSGAVSSGSGGGQSTGAGGTAGSAGTGTGAIGTAGTGSGATGTAGTGSGATGTGGTGGAPAGAGGGPTGVSGRGGGVAGASAGRGGAAGGAVGGAAGSSTGAAGAGAGDEYVSGVTITVHPQTVTILNVAWTQAKAADQVWLEFTFTGGSMMTSRPLAGAAGAHKDVVLGVPASTAVTVRIVSKLGSVEYKTKDYQGMTGTLPSGMPKPTVTMYDAALASTDRWMFGAVENSAGGCNNSSCYYNALFWLYIMDRQGRIVWYYADATGNPTSSFQRIARDGEYIWIEKRPFTGSGNKSVLKMTLDRTYSQMINVPDLSDAIDVTSDGSLLYDTEPSWELREMNKAGTVRTIWRCPTAMGSGFMCYSNTINWDPASDTIMMSFPYENTVAQIDRKTGTLVATYGQRTGSYAFDVANWTFEFQHFANISSKGTLLVSSHLPGNDRTSSPVANQHAFEEFTIDRTNKRLIQKWVYSDGPEWAMYKGMVILLPNGNYLGNYGTGGVIREITPDKKTVFHVKWDVTTGNDFFNKMVGHNVLINDLYALNGGGPK